MTWTAQVVRTLRTAREVTDALGPRLAGVGEVIAGSRSANVVARAGIVEIRFGTRAIGWLDRHHRKGAVYTPEHRLLCWVRDGEAIAAFDKVPAALARAIRTLRPAAPVTPPRAHHRRTTSVRDDAMRLPDIEKAQLVAASRELCGRAGLAALFAYAAATEQQLVYLQFGPASAPRFDAWVWSSLDDGVFFDHGDRTPNGLAISERRVHDMTADREAEVRALQAAWKTIRIPKQRIRRG